MASLPGSVDAPSGYTSTPESAEMETRATPVRMPTRITGGAIWASRDRLEATGGADDGGALGTGRSTGAVRQLPAIAASTAKATSNECPLRRPNPKAVGRASTNDHPLISH